jgi:hypothetical protein
VREYVGQHFDFVITVCDSARQDCPVFPGEGQRLHWGYDDPSQVEGDEETRLRAFRRVFTAISQRIDLFQVEAARAFDPPDSSSRAWTAPGAKRTRAAPGCHPGPVRSQR